MESLYMKNTLIKFHFHFLYKIKTNNHIPKTTRISNAVILHYILYEFTIIV